MKKILLVLIISLFSFSRINAQKGSNSIKIHAAAEIPVGFFATGYNAGWGLHVTDYIRTGNKGGDLLLSAGFASWKDKLGANIKAGLVLIRGGYRQFVSSGFYFQLEAGVAILVQDWGQGSRFSYGGGAGYLIKSKKGKGGIDISAKFNRITYRSWIGLGLGYQFETR